MNNIQKKRVRSIKFSIRKKITFTVAITLFIIIFLTAFFFTQVFLINNRNIRLEEISAQNKKFSDFVSQNYSGTSTAVINLQSSGLLDKFQNILGTKITIIDEKYNVIFNPLGLSDRQFREIVLSNKDLRRFMILSSQNDGNENFGRLIDSRISDRKYYISIYEFEAGGIKYYSIFFKNQSEVEIPRSSYFLALIVIFFTALIVSGLAGFILGRHLSNPILKLSRAVEKISSGDYDKKINIRDTDEIGTLAKNIDLMKDKIKRSQSSLKDFTSMISHEIKNMLTSIQGYSIGIRDGVYHDKDEVGQALDIVISKTLDLENLTNSLLILSKVENKIIEINKVKINIVDLAENLIDLYRPELLKHNIGLKQNFGPEDKIYISSDKYLFQSILSNLINNAVKYSEKNSTINVNINRKGNNIIFSVNNKSKPISRDDRERIYKMFNRPDKVDFRNIKSFGLGLAISKRLSSLLGYHLIFDTADSINTFSLKIPYK